MRRQVRRLLAKLAAGSRQDWAPWFRGYTKREPLVWVGTRRGSLVDGGESLVKPLTVSEPKAPKERTKRPHRKIAKRHRGKGSRKRRREARASAAAPIVPPPQPVSEWRPPSGSTFHSKYGRNLDLENTRLSSGRHWYSQQTVQAASSYRPPGSYLHEPYNPSIHKPRQEKKKEKPKSERPAVGPCSECGETPNRSTGKLNHWPGCSRYTAGT